MINSFNVNTSNGSTFLEIKKSCNYSNQCFSSTDYFNINGNWCRNSIAIYSKIKFSTASISTSSDIFCLISIAFNNLFNISCNCQNNLSKSLSFDSIINFFKKRHQKFQMSFFVF
ncbi:Uncharacterised protein [Metamycoplasma alkalescens]|uniref:Uncharacterized protein n=1 Tax=Metamycoplasma alkalescens TaxID=45363 RepID=A0A3B0P8J5_9BACT|nr:Uncharacterised protein [Metamycoplasma alkalescens]